MASHQQVTFLLLTRRLRLVDRWMETSSQEDGFLDRFYDSGNYKMRWITMEGS